MACCCGAEKVLPSLLWTAWGWLLQQGRASLQVESGASLSCCLTAARVCLCHAPLLGGGSGLISPDHPALTAARAAPAPPASLSVPGSLPRGRRAAGTPRQRPVPGLHRPERSPLPRFGRASAPVWPGEVPGRSRPTAGRPAAFIRALGLRSRVGRPLFVRCWGRARVGGGPQGARRQGGGASRNSLLN